ncbi:adenylyl-sulfate kinase [Paenibacillus durus]|uniref:Adenylyl-sulfate kinase n=1 Tax=Paenibacillus durus ATCC 35681 TaxID=1333534 RepID=A0A0F7CKH9_PAEDU|nr:adenylyl-sulfate kinase [Paenibacillus durus]AKG37691.1 adenylylsulfate kinase [Paenibacillus durus ATCC 35681]
MILGSIKGEGSAIRRKAIERMNGHRGGVVWFTGLSGSGKTTLSQYVEEALFKRGFKCVVLDGDQLRAGLNRDLGFSEEDREENLRRAAEVAAMFLNAGFVALVPMISPSREARDKIRHRFDSRDFAEVYVKCSIEVCERRDPKGLYQKARKGEIRHFTGIDALYEAPIQPELTIDTEHSSVENCTQQLVEFIIRKFDIKSEREEA